MTAIERLIRTAEGEVGYLEKNTNAQLDASKANAGYKNYTKYARDLDALFVYNTPKQGYSWCDIFVDWLFIHTFGLDFGMRMLCQPMGGYGAGCTESARYFRNAGRFFKAPQVGNQVFFTKDKGQTFYHTGILVAMDDKYIYTIEGNTSSKTGVVENGGSVEKKRYPKNYAYIGGYGRPRYELIPDMPEEEKTMPDKDFQEKWNSAMAEYRKSLQDNDSAAYSKEAREWAVSNGLINGGDTMDDGSPNYMWDDFMSRQQFVAVLYRFARMCGLA